jgi:hypothetical protein
MIATKILFVIGTIAVLIPTAFAENAFAQPAGGNATSASVIKADADTVSKLAKTEPVAAAAWYDLKLSDVEEAQALNKVLSKNHNDVKAAIESTLDNASNLGIIKKSSVEGFKGWMKDLFSSQKLDDIYNKGCGNNGLIRTMFKNDSSISKWALPVCELTKNVKSNPMSSFAPSLGVSAASISNITNSDKYQNTLKNVTALGVLAYGQGLLNGTSKGINNGLDAASALGEVKSAHWWNKAIDFAKVAIPIAVAIVG